MRTTIDRYVFREILPPFFLALLIFTFLLVLPPVMDYLENAGGQGGDLGHRRPDPLDPAPAGARADDPDGRCWSGSSSASGGCRPTARRWRCWPAASAPTGCCGRSAPWRSSPRRVTDVRDDRGHPGRQPDLPGNHLRRRDARRSKPTFGRGCSSGFPGLGALRPRRAGPRPAGWKDCMVARDRQTARPRSISPSAAAWSSTARSAAVDLVLTDGTIYTTGKPGDDRQHTLPRPNWSSG